VPLRAIKQHFNKNNADESQADMASVAFHQFTQVCFNSDFQFLQPA
jgi:hypothetical protein